MAYIIKNKAEFNKQLRRAGSKMILVHFVSRWCAKCNGIAPILDEILKSYVARLLILKVDIDECQDLAIEFGINQTPTYVFIKNNLVVTSFSGGTVEKVQQVFNKYLG